MAFEENGSSMYMPVAPAYGGGGGFGADNGWWIILLLLACGGWGGGFGGGFGGYGGAALGVDFPWVLNGQQTIMANTNNGFRDALLNDGITGIQGNLSDIQTQLCGGFAGVTASVNGAQNAIAQQLYTNQIADLERSFAAQTANTAGLTSLQSQLFTCCCENKTLMQQGFQTVLDKLCQQELDAERRDNQNLRSELMYARGQASQVAQTAAIEASQSAQTQYIVNRVAPYPVPAYVVANPVTPAFAAAAV